MAERKTTIEKFGVIFAIWDGENIQLEKRDKPESAFFGFTLIPGGKVEPDETYEMALRREVREEYGVNVRKFQPIGVIRTIEDGCVVNFRHVYLVTGWEGELGNPEGTSHFAAGLEEARKICKHPISQRILDFVEAKLPGQNS